MWLAFVPYVLSQSDKRPRKDCMHIQMFTIHADILVYKQNINERMAMNTIIQIYD